MKTLKQSSSALVACGLLFGFSAGAEDFTGSFTGSYFSGWTAFANDNPVVTQLSSYELQPFSLTLRGAASPSLVPNGTASLIDFTHPVVGTGPTTISFNSLFFAEIAAHENDSASFLVNGSVVQSLSLAAQDQSFSFVLNPGDVFGFRLTSDNDNIRDYLQITQFTPVPEPSVLALAALGGLLLAGIRNRQRL